MRLHLQNSCPQNEPTESILLFLYPNILLFLPLRKTLFLPLSFFFPSRQLFYLPDVHELLLNIILQIFPSVCLIRVVKDTFSDIGLPDWTLFSYPAPPEAARALWRLQDASKCTASFRPPGKPCSL